jgi:DNA-directed RNA polymerase subunit RPC12/RpoP
MNKQQKSVKGESVELEEGKKYTVHSGEKNVKDIVGWAADFGKDSGIPGVMKNGITDIKYGAKKVSFGGKSAKNLAQYFAKTHGLKVTNEELEEGGVKDFLMDVEDDAGSMSLNDLIKKYYGLMGLTAQEIKKIYYRVNESVNEESEEKEEVKSLRDTIHDVWNQAANEEEKREEDAKWLKTEAKSEIKCPNCGHMNDADAKKCSNCGHDLTKSEEKDSKKKTMTGSPASKVDTTPEVEFEK